MAYIKPTNQQEQPARAWGKNNNSIQQQQTATAPFKIPKQEDKKMIDIEATFLYITPSINKKTGQPKQGIDKNGKPYTCYDVVFNKPGSQQNKIFEVFNDLNGKSLRLNQLVQGLLYKLVYEQGIMGIKKNRLFFIGSPQRQIQQAQVPPMVNQGAFKPQNSFQQQPLASAPIQAPPQQKNPENNPQQQPIHASQNKPVNPYVAPEHQQLWDSVDFSPKWEFTNKEEEARWDKEVHDNWMKIAYDSKKFSSIEEAERVWRMLSGE